MTCPYRSLTLFGVLLATLTRLGPDRIPQFEQPGAHPVDERPVEEQRSAAAELLGTWRDMECGETWTFLVGAIELREQDGFGYRFPYLVYPERKPKGIDLGFSFNDQPQRGIYEVTSRQLLLCYPRMPGARRPWSFPTPDSPGLLFGDLVMRRFARVDEHQP